MKISKNHIRKTLVEKTLGTNNIEFVVLILREELKRLKFSMNKTKKEIELIESEINKINKFIEKNAYNEDLPC